MKTGIELIAEERQRQVTEEHRTASHDDAHKLGQMAGAGACYALHAAGFIKPQNIEAMRKGVDTKVPLWPWAECYWKPMIDDPRRDLAKAGALIAAEIDRLNRLEVK